jgi:hypothetical protein
MVKPKQVQSKLHMTKDFNQFYIAYPSFLMLQGPVPLLNLGSAVSNKTLMAWLLYYGQSEDVYSLTQLTISKACDFV